MGYIIDDHNDDGIREYYSAEFKLNQTRIFYQFKIRKSAAEPMFAVVKEGSKALDNIKAGDVINMRYYCLDKTIPVESFDTKIKHITKDGLNGFKNHYIIGLDIESKEDRIVA